MQLWEKAKFIPRSRVWTPSSLIQFEYVHSSRWWWTQDQGYDAVDINYTWRWASRKDCISSSLKASGAKSAVEKTGKHRPLVRGLHKILGVSGEETRWGVGEGKSGKSGKACPFTKVSSHWVNPFCRVLVSEIAIFMNQWIALMLKPLWAGFSVTSSKNTLNSHLGVLTFLGTTEYVLSFITWLLQWILIE